LPLGVVGAMAFLDVGRTASASGEDAAILGGAGAERG
jgi:hypothetical protein